MTEEQVQHIRKLLDKYNRAVEDKSVTLRGVPTHLYIAETIVNLSLDGLLAEVERLRELVQAMASYPAIGDEQVTPQTRLLQLRDQARAILAENDEHTS